MEGQEEWVELEDRLQEAAGGIIIAQDMSEHDTKYRIMQGTPPAEHPSGSNKTGGMVSVSETSGAGKYKNGKIFDLMLNRRIGKGGFGAVFQFEMTNSTYKLRKDICLKQAHYRTDDELLQENKIFLHIAKGQHKHIIMREFMCSTSTDYFLGLEYFDGKDLNSLMSMAKEQRITIDSRNLMLILTQQTKAIQYLQKCRVFHGDIKPENVLYNPKSETSKLIDFGLASRMDTDDKIGGTTVYMAPEALIEKQRQSGTDIFSLGATLHSLITLERPWYTLNSIKEIKSNPPRDKRERQIAMWKAIENEILAFRNRETVIGKFQHMSIQAEMLSIAGCDETIKGIVFSMLHHDPIDRPLCQDILDQFEPRTDSSEADSMRMSWETTTNNLSDIYVAGDMLPTNISDGDSLETRENSGQRTEDRGNAIVERRPAAHTSADLHQNIGYQASKDVVEIPRLQQPEDRRQQSAVVLQIPVKRTLEERVTALEHRMAAQQPKGDDQESMITSNNYM